MNEEEVKKAILVVQQAMTAFAKQAITEICANEGLTIEWFMVRAVPCARPRTRTRTRTPQLTSGPTTSALPAPPLVG